jgi:ATP-dependent DNA helicase RecG
VTLRLTGAVTSRERAWVRGLVREGRLEGRAGILVVEAARTGSLSNSVAREKLGIDSVEARALLRSLVAAGVLVQHGQRGGATYHIAPDLGVPARIRHTDDELDRIALALAAQGPVTNASLRAGTGLDRQEALKVLRRLADRGALVARGRGRGAHYERPA